VVQPLEVGSRPVVGNTVEAAVSHSGHFWTYTYSKDGVLQQIEDDNGNITPYSNYDRFKPRTVTRPGNPVPGL
jgi:uncharacterized protein RhaS with RHS repeats